MQVKKSGSLGCGASGMKDKMAVRFIPNKEKLAQLEREYPDFKPYYIEMIQALFQFSIDLEKSIEHFHSKNGFSRSRYLILMVLLHEEGNRLAPNEIAQKLNVTRGNMTGIVDCLIKDGYVKKYQDEKDRRQVWIEMTAAGDDYLKKVFPDYFKRLGKMMSVITRAEGEELIRISRKLHGAVGALTE